MTKEGIRSKCSFSDKSFFPYKLTFPSISSLGPMPPMVAFESAMTDTGTPWISKTVPRIFPQFPSRSSSLMMNWSEKAFTKLSNAALAIAVCKATGTSIAPWPKILPKQSTAIACEQTACFPTQWDARRASEAVMPRLAVPMPSPPETVLTWKYASSRPVWTLHSAISRLKPVASRRRPSTALRPPESSWIKPKWLLACPHPAWPTTPMTPNGAADKDIFVFMS